VTDKAITEDEIKSRMQEILDTVRKLQLQSTISQSAAIVNVLLQRQAATELLLERFGALLTMHLGSHVEGVDVLAVPEEGPVPQ
jgi:hypothetical protein